MKKQVKIGNAGGFWGDRPGAAAELIQQQPDLDYLTLDYLSELSMSIMAIQREKNPKLGFAKDFVAVVRSLIPYWKEGIGVKMITNAGGLNPLGLAKECLAELTKFDCEGIKIACITGDDVLNDLKENPTNPLYHHLDTSHHLTAIEEDLTTANAYLGASPIVEALSQGANIVITGRVADASLTVAPCAAHFGWSLTEYDKLAGATIAGHLIECGTQVTGGMSTNWLKIKESKEIGFPFVEVEEDGTFVITKSKYSGGVVNEETVKEQLLYEVGDPFHFITPDVCVSLASVRLQLDGENRIRVFGAQGTAPTDTYKVSATHRCGFKTEALLTIFGQQAKEKARFCGKLLLDRVYSAGYHIENSLIECLGSCDAVPGVIFQPVELEGLEVVLRVSLISHQKAALEYFAKEVASLVTCGPQGVTGYSSGRPKVRPVFGFWPCLQRKDKVCPKMEIFP